MASPLNAHEELARLIAEQARDDAQRRIRGTHESDLAPADDPGRRVLEELSDPRDADPAEALEALEAIDLQDSAAVYAYRMRTGSIVGPKLIGLTAPWQAAELAYQGGQAPCSAHPAGPPPRGSICLICSASQLEPRQHPMIGTPTRPPRAARKAKGKKARSKGKAGRPVVVAELAGGLGPIAV